MRTAFIQRLLSEARKNPRIFLVVGDLGYSVVEPFRAEFPERFLNVGVAEQNMTGVAAGLASEGYHVFTYSIANFPTLRCLEQIRNDVCYHDLPVTITAVGAGVSYGNLGYSHHALQDVAIMRTLGNVTVLSPADPREAAGAVSWLSANPRPSYLRLGKANEPVLHTTETVDIGRGLLPLHEADGPMAIVGTGSVVKTALDAIAEGGAEFAATSVYSLPWLHPLSAAMLAPLRRFRRIIAIEEHVAAGGLASALREHLDGAVAVEGLSFPVELVGEVGSQEDLRTRAGLTGASVRHRLAEARE